MFLASDLLSSIRCRQFSVPSALQLGLLVSAMAPLAHAQNRFPPIATSYPAPAMVALVAVEDFNGDGHPDALLLNGAFTHTLSLMAGDGKGGFGPPVVVVPTFSGGQYIPGDFAIQGSGEVITGDFNGDGIPDIAVLNLVSAGTVMALHTGQVFIGIGDGTFKAMPQSALISDVSAVISAVGDFNGDGKADLLIADPAGKQVIVFPGDGAGNLGSPMISSTPAMAAPGPVIAADLRNEGILDLAMTNSGANIAGEGGSYIQLMTGDGKGHFTAGEQIQTRAALINSLTAADLLGDGKLELVLATGIAYLGAPCYVGPGVAVLKLESNGDWKETDYPTGTGSFIVAVADLNGDGRPDIVTANSTTRDAIEYPGSFSVLLNQGRDAPTLFAPTVTYAKTSGQLLLKDLTGNGRPDVIVGYDHAISVVRNLGSGNFSTGTVIDVGLGIGDVKVADLNRDGIPDFAVTGSTFCYSGSDAGSKFASAVSANGLPFQTQYRVNSVGESISSLGAPIALGDLIGNGNVDAVLGGSSTGTMIWLANNGAGAFSIPANSNLNESTEYPFTLADFNGDGRADLAQFSTSEEYLQILLSEGNGQFGPPTNYPPGSLGNFGGPVPTGGDFGPMVTQDLRGDGHQDLLYANGYTSEVEVFLGNGDGTFQAEKDYPVSGQIGTTIAFGDFNRDGKVDLAVATDTGVSILFGKGDGTFSAPTAVAIPGGAPYLAVADLGGSGIDDLIVSENVTDLDGAFPYTLVLSGDGNGSFGPPQTYFGAGFNVIPADFNGDGAIDLLELSANAGPVVIYNQGGTYISLSSSAPHLSVPKGQIVTLTASVTASIPGTGTPTGRVKFMNGKTQLGTAILANGKAELSLPNLAVGSYWVKAIYEGNSNFNQHQSSLLPIIVEP